MKMSHFLIGGMFLIFISGFLASRYPLDGMERISTDVIDAGNGIHFEINSETELVTGFWVSEIILIDGKKMAYEDLTSDEITSFIHQTAIKQFGENSKTYQEFIIFMDQLE